MSFATYKEKPVLETVLAVQFDGKSNNGVNDVDHQAARWTQGDYTFILGTDQTGVHAFYNGLRIRPGQWLVQHPSKTLEVFDDAFFKERYDSISGVTSQPGSPPVVSK